MFQARFYFPGPSNSSTAVLASFIVAIDAGTLEEAQTAVTYDAERQLYIVKSRAAYAEISARTLLGYTIDQT